LYKPKRLAIQEYFPSNAKKFKTLRSLSLKNQDEFFRSKTKIVTFSTTKYHLSLPHSIVYPHFTSNQVFFGSLIVDCTRKNNLPKKWQQIEKFFAKKLQIKKIWIKSLDCG